MPKTEPDQALIERTFGLSITAMQQVRSGNNDVFKLETDLGIKALKISDKSSAHVRFEQEFLVSLAEAGFRNIPQALRVVDASNIDDVVSDTIAVVGQRPHRVFDWIDGSECQGDIQKIQQAGQFLAQFHEVSHDILQHRLQTGQTDNASIRSQWGDLVVRYPPEGTGELIEGYDLWSDHVRQTYSFKPLRSPTVYLERAVGDASDVGSLVRDCAPLVAQMIDKTKRHLYDLGFRCESMRGQLVYHCPLPLAIVHSDYAPQNVKFGDKGEVTMLDLDNANARERVYDIAWGLAMFSAEPSGELAMAKMQAFLRGYTSVTSLHELEAAVIPCEIYTRCIETIYWAVRNHYFSHAGSLAYARHDYNIMKWLACNEDDVLQIGMF